jgi:hypothetical protein
MTTRQEKFEAERQKMLSQMGMDDEQVEIEKPKKKSRQERLAEEGRRELDRINRELDREIEAEKKKPKKKKIQRVEQEVSDKRSLANAFQNGFILTIIVSFFMILYFICQWFSGDLNLPSLLLASVGGSFFVWTTMTLLAIFVEGCKK